MESDLVLTDVGVEATGELRSVGQWAGLCCTDRSQAAEFADDRWVWYAQDGQLRLWHSEKGDVLTISPAGFLDLTGEDLQRHGSIATSNIRVEGFVDSRTGFYNRLDQNAVIKGLQDRVATLEATLKTLHDAVERINPNALRGL